jgi:hypothetical protein
VAILRSLPGVGRIVCATLLAKAHHVLRAQDDHARADRLWAVACAMLKRRTLDDPDHRGRVTAMPEST